jgi:hypothetical protein
MRSISIFLFFVVFSKTVFSQQKKLTDNLPGKYLTSQSDTSILAYRTSSGLLGDFDIILDAYNNTNNLFVSSWYVGTTGRDFHADILISDNNYFLTGYSNLLTGFSDDIIVSRVSYDETESWVKILRGNVGDKGNRIFQENDSIIILANTNSFSSNQSLIIATLSKEGDLLNQWGYDFGEAFFPTDLVFNSDHYFVSGYTSSGTYTEGVVLKIRKSDKTIIWAKRFENSFSTELQQLFIDEDKLYFSGWSGDGSYKAFFIGEMNLDGQLQWRRTSSLDGFTTTIDINKKDDHLYVSGFIRVFNGNEEEEFLAKTNIITKEVEVFAIEDINRTFSSGEIKFINDTVLLSSFQILSDLSHKGLNTFWENNNNGCFNVYEVDSIISQDYVQFLDQIVTEFSPTLTEILEGEVIKQSSNFGITDNCVASPLYAKHNLATCSDISIVYNFSDIILKAECDLVIDGINVYSSMGELVYRTNKWEIPQSIIEENKVYLIEVLFAKDDKSMQKQIIKITKLWHAYLQCLIS